MELEIQASTNASFLSNHLGEKARQRVRAGVQ
jgi:hypothetical protein